ncbi:CBO0543 family protein [Cohnella sp. GCM10012308]|uniref:CBO0543 family protein n=1 Tax=Cohnella sp. GCM10012308 TaxID=3317329 RepID=UPI003613BA97
MVINWIIGFIIPWLCLALIPVPNKRNLCLRVGPIGSLIAFLFNDIFVRYGFWIAKPITDANESFSTLPFNLGLYPVWGIFLVYFIERRTWSPIFVIFFCSLGITFAEWILVKLKWILYGNGWNIGWTYCSYLVAFTIVYSLFSVQQRQVN